MPRCPSFRPLPALRLAALLLTLAAAALTSSGCGQAIDYLFARKPDDTARELFDEAQAAMAEKRYAEAAGFYQKLKDRYPFSPYTMRAELGLGDAHYLRKDYPDAIAAYKEYESLHPRDGNIPYVLYQIGMANKLSFDSLDRPMSYVTEATEYFTRVAQGYPGTPYAEKAATELVESRRLLAEHELYVAEFYWRAGRYNSAWQRYTYVVDNFADLPDIVEYARQRAQVAYLEHQQESAEQDRRQRHGTWRNLFKWL